MANWRDLEDELALWRVEGTLPTLWWRDDDAETHTPALDRLLALAGRHRIPIHLAVIPIGATQALGRRIADVSAVDVLQHGWAHVNHEPKGHGASEVGLSRSLDQQRADLLAGWARLQELQMPGLMHGFAAPWNRIGPDTPALLRDLGFSLVSTNLTRRTAHPVPGLTQVNVHADPIRWKDGPRFRGVQGFLACVVDHLQQRRRGETDRDEPTGITTHHLQTSDEIWSFLDHFCGRIAPDVRWLQLSKDLRITT
ncbi:MAG: polysaccharide deacetylase [Rhodobacteraceae bacterium]|nr:polysaccharide deacetylase [Paracoccaceae bacterium]